MLRKDAHSRVLKMLLAATALGASVLQAIRFVKIKKKMHLTFVNFVNGEHLP